MEDRARPSLHGAILGRVLAIWAQKGALPSDRRPCGGCAFRHGAIANRLAPTVGEALDCTVGTDPAGFGCHKGLVDGEPTQACAGWLAAQRYVEANFDQSREDLRINGETIAMVGDDRPDPIRADFEIFLDRVDPERRLDDYSLAALWRPEQEASR